MKLSASQAAKETGKSVPTITRAIKSGRISASKNDTGGFEIDPAELFRVFPPLTLVSDVTPKLLGDETPNSNGVLEVEVKMLREMLEQTRTDRDAWKAQAEQALRLLPPPPAKRRAWWNPFGANDQK